MSYFFCTLLRDEPKSRQVQKLNFVVSFVSYLVISPIAWDELDTCQALMDFLFRRHQTSFILSSFQTFLLKSSIKVECVQGTVKDLNWNARRQTQRVKWSVIQDFLLVSEAEAALWLADTLPQLFSEQSPWLFIWMSIYIVAGHYKDYPQSQYFLGWWHQAWWLDSLCHPQKKCSIFKTH